MYIIHFESSNKFRVAINRLDRKDITAINKSKRFDFNWNKEKEFEVYQLAIGETGEVVGLMSLEDRPDDYVYQIRVLASSKENIGKEKQYDRIAGCLIAFACRKAFSAGYGGYVCLKPKTKLKEHYQKIYGMVSTKMYLVTEGENSSALIKKYYDEQ